MHHWPLNTNICIIYQWPDLVPLKCYSASSCCACVDRCHEKWFWITDLDVYGGDNHKEVVTEVVCCTDQTCAAAASAADDMERETKLCCRSQRRWRCRFPSGREDLSVGADGRTVMAAPRACAAAAPAADDPERETELCYRSRHRWRCLPPSGREDLSVEADGRTVMAAPRACAAAAPAADDS